MAKRRTSKRRPRKGNPQFRYVVVPVDLNDDEEADVAYIVRVPSRGSREIGLQTIARAVDADALVNVVDTRSFPTKHAAMRKAAQMAPRTEVLEGA